MAEVKLNKLPLFCGNQLTIFRTLFSIHTYLTQSASSKNFYELITSLVKTNQRLKFLGLKFGIVYQDIQEIETKHHQRY